jgi:hypothetical protein
MIKCKKRAGLKNKNLQKSDKTSLVDVKNLTAGIVSRREVIRSIRGR